MQFVRLFEAQGKPVSSYREDGGVGGKASFGSLFIVACSSGVVSRPEIGIAMTVVQGDLLALNPIKLVLFPSFFFPIQVSTY